MPPSKSEGAQSPSTAPTALLKRLLAVAPSSRRAVLVAGVFAGVATVFIVAQAVAIARICGAAFAGSTASHLGLWLVLIAAVVGRALIALVQPLALERLVAPVRRSLRTRLLAQILVDRDSGRHGVDGAVLLATRGVDGAGQYLTSYLPALVTSLVAPIVVLVWLCATDLLSSIIVIATVVVLPIFMVLLGLEAKEHTAMRWRDLSALAGHFGDVVRGLPTLKAHNGADRALDGLDASGEQLRVSSMATLKVALLSGFALELLSSLAVALVALTLGLRLLGGHLSLSVALAVLIVTPEVYLPLRTAAARFHAATDGVAASMVLLDSLESSSKAPSTVRLTKAPSITVTEVVARRNERMGDAIVPLSFSVGAGETVLVVGPSGVGKSTLLSMLAGLHSPSSGSVQVDSISLGPGVVLEGVGYLPQDPALSGATVRDALSFEMSPPSDSMLSEALLALGLDLELDRPLGEHASTLSAGQRRRLGLCRVLLSKPALLLLDEPDAHLDHDAALLVACAIGRTSATCVIVSHDPSLYDADQVVTLATEATSASH